MKKGSMIVLCATAICAAAAAAIAVSRTPKNVDVADVTFGDFTKTIEATGKVNAQQVVSVVAKNGGTVAAVSVKEGQMVKVGDPLLQLDRKQIEQLLKQAKRELEDAKARVRQATEVSDETTAQGVTPVLNMQEESLEASVNRSVDAVKRAQGEGIDYQTLNESIEAARDAMAEQTMAGKTQDDEQEVKEASAQVKNVSSRIKELENALSATTLSSEADGTVVAMQVTKGDVLEKGRILLQIADTSKLTVVALVPLDDLYNVKVGQRAQIWQNDRAWKGTVARVNPTVENVNDVMMGEVEVIPDEGFQEFIGEALDVSIITEQEKDVCMVPTECVALDESGPFVLAVEGDRLIKRPVSVGLQDDYNIVIANGLQVGEQAALFPEELLDVKGRIRALN